jgi:hypothetical protein
MSRLSKRNGPHNIDIYSLIFGSLLGDSYAEKRNGSTRIILQQEESNVSYLMWFHQYLATRGYCSLKKPRLGTRIGLKNKVRFFYRVRTYSFASFNWIYEAFYPNSKKKEVPKVLCAWTLLTPLALAVWIMNNGTPVSAGLKIATHAFTERDILFLCDVLNKKYNLYARPHCDKHQFVVYIPKAGMPKLSDLISTYMVPSMHRKLNGYYLVRNL